MPIGEDLPALLPISIAIVILILGMTALYVNYIGKSEAIDMHRIALNAVEKFYYENHGVLNWTLLGNPTYFTLNYSGFEIGVVVKDLDRSKEWVYGETGNFSIVVSLPVIIKEAGTSYTGKIYTKVRRK